MSAKLGRVAQKLRSKNAGPFWLTIDIFCGTAEAYQEVVSGLSLEDVARAFAMPTQTLKRFDIPDLNVIKISLPRPHVQGAATDHDIHGASWAVLVAEIELRQSTHAGS